MSRSRHTVVVCMGSSCFSRGNNRNIEVIQGFIARRGLEGEVDLRGHLCENECKLGPNIVVDDTPVHDVHPVMLEALLKQSLTCDNPAGTGPGDGKTKP